MNSSFAFLNQSLLITNGTAHMAPMGNAMFLQSAVRCLQVYVAPVLAISGCLSNLMCLVCLSGSNQPRGCTVAISLVVAEMIQLICLLCDWTAEIGFDIYVITGWCHFITFLKRSSHFLDQWYLITLMVSSIKCTLFIKKREAITVAVLLFAVSLAIYLNISLTTTLLYIGARPVCMTIQGDSIALQYFEHVHSIINIMLPIILNIVGFVYINIINYRIGSYANDTFTNYVLIHIALWLPIQFCSLTSLIIAIQNGNTSLNAFLIEEIARYIHFFNMTINFCLLSCSSQTLRMFVRRRLLWIFCRIEEVEYITRGAQTSDMDLRLVSEV